MSEEWKVKLKKYYEGSLSDEEAKEMEDDLEKLDTYQEMITEELDSDRQTEVVRPEELSADKAGEILKSSIRHARFSLTAYVIMIILLIYPLMTMASYIYYGWDNKANNFIDVAIQTVYVTQPNVSLEEMHIEREVGLFTFDVYMDVYKRVGKRDIKQGDWQVMYQFEEATFPKKNIITETPLNDNRYSDTKMLYHPEEASSYQDIDPWETLENLPDGTVAEVYVSLNELKELENMKEVTEDLDVEWRWYAIDTGLEASGKIIEGGNLAPIGYPAQTDPESWSPYNNSEDNQDQFIKSLLFLKKYEKQAANIADAELELDRRINYLEKEGIHVFGGVVTGPTKELLKLKDRKDVRTINIGEVRLWNW